MRKTFLIFTSLCCAYLAQAQPVIQYKTHAPQAGDHTVMLKADYILPGPAGANMTWDFSHIKWTGEQENNDLSVISTESQSPYAQTANIATQVTDDYTCYFNVNEKAHLQVGYAGKDYKTIYSQPMKRITYPFAYGYSYGDSFVGKGIYTTGNTDVVGNYTVEADAYGTLQLPNNIVLKNVLRVKTTSRKYESQACFTAETQQVKYLYYTGDYRYPVFAIMETQIIQNEKTTTSYFSAMSSKLLFKDEQANQGKDNKRLDEQSKNWTVYPNPFQGVFTAELTLTEQSNVTMQLFSEDGRLLGKIVNSQILDAGRYTYQYDGSQLSSGTYYILYTVGENAYAKPIIRIK